MINRTNRFHGQKAIMYVLKAGQSARTGQLMLKYAPNSRRQEYRLAVVVSRKVSKSAVVRNRIRRRLYEQIRNQAAAFDGAFDMVLLVYSPDIAALPSTEIAGLLTTLLGRAKIIKPTAPRRGNQAASRGIVKGKESGS